MCIFIGIPLDPGTRLSILANEADISGVVVQCSFRENGYLVGVELDERCEWIDGSGPEHLLDVMLLDLS
jgi:hypothetical protein